MTASKTAKTTPADVKIPPRDIRFDFDGVKTRHWLSGDPVGTAVFNALSLTFPDGERMFVDAVRHYRDRVEGKLVEDVKGFIVQESIHSREHHTLNQLIDRDFYPVAGIEASIKERVAYARSRGPMRMLLSTIALEHLTSMMADVHAANQQLFEGAPPGVERLWRWHAMEETEHKAVAFDVFMAATKDWTPFQRYFRRCMVMAIIGIMFPRNIANYAAMLLQADGYSEKEALKAVKRFLWREPGIFGRGWKIYFAWFKPGFHPWDHDNRALVTTWRKEFDAALAPAAA
ncbi:MAG: metal-dependent hydrolase [Hyphomonadaceae bacterium]